MAVYKKCALCSGEIVVGLYDPIRVPDPQTGELVTLQLPRHRVSVPQSVLFTAAMKEADTEAGTCLHLGAPHAALLETQPEPTTEVQP